MGCERAIPVRFSCQLPGQLLICVNPPCGIGFSVSKNRQGHNVTQNNMQNVIQCIASLGYQFGLLHCLGGLGLHFINAISPAQEALIFTTLKTTATQDADRVAGLFEANEIYKAKLLVNRVCPDMIHRNDIMSVRDGQDMSGIPLSGATPEDNHVINLNRLW